MQFLDYSKFPEVQRHFTGGLQYDKDGNLFLKSSDETKLYVGNSSAVDQAWEVFNAGGAIHIA
jgi:hypothetical protein